jgi:hypothetical protein
MKRTTFDALVGFLQGIFWAILLLGAWLTYHIAANFGVGFAVIMTFIYIFVMLIALLLIEAIRLQRIRTEEVQKQTELLRTLLAQHSPEAQ